MKYFAFLLLFSCALYGQTFSNTALNTTGSWNGSLTKTVSVNGISNLQSGVFELAQVNLDLGENTATRNLNTYSITLSKGSVSIQLVAVGGLPNANINRINTKLRFNSFLRRPFEHGATAEPFEIGYYRSQDNLNAFNGIDPNGDWTVQINESSFATGVQFNKVELVFRNPFTVLDYTSINSYDNCQTPYCLGISEIIVASNNGFTNQVGDMYNPNTSSCSWNAAQNNSAWFKFRAAAANVKITISGITNNLQILGINAGPDENPCTVNDNQVLAGGCPNLAINDTYSSPQYVNGSSKNNQLNLSGLIPGVVYYFLVDGTGAAVSPFYIEIEGASVNCSNCNINPVASSNSPLCEGQDLVLSVDQGVSWLWTGPNNFSSSSNNPIVSNVGAASNGTYTVLVTDSNGCTETVSTVVAVNTPITPTFTAVAPICSGATLAALPTTSNNGITGTWSPALNNTATTTYTFTPNTGQCATTTTLTITVNPQVTPTFTAVAPICSGATLAALPTTSNNGITGTWSPALNNTTTTTYTFTPNTGQCATTTTLTITVNPQVAPTFTAVAPICSGATVAALPTTSNNGITGTWAPALNNTATTTYTFTPNAGQCATSTTLTITVNPQVTPTFTAVAPICAGATLSALPTTSNNGITGTWAPALNNTATTTYTFTPSAGQCATTTTLTITVNPQVTPTFTAVAPICAGATLAALPTTSNNGISGTWAPALNNTATTTYTFTPNAGQCATTTTLTITVNPQVTPTFTAVAPICAGATLSALPTTSNNGISGTWSPALNNTATTTYTFTPNTGQCATTTTLTITVNPQVTPTFTVVAPICSGATVAALPTTSNNGINGTWSPALNNTATTTYTFTPNTGQCATTTTLTITVNPQVTPTFAIANQTYCQGAPVIQPILPIISTNGIAGSWSPSSISTTQVGVTTHIFTPNEGQCALTTSLTITVNVLEVPTFDSTAPICAGDILMELSTISNNGISGTWSPALNNTATTTYTFTPNIGQCASVFIQTIVVVSDPQLVIQGDCEGDEYVLRVLPAPQNGTVSWFYDSVGTNPIFLGNTTFIVADQIGTYTVVYNNSSCERQYTFFVENNNCKIPKGVSANNDGLNDTFDLSNLKVKYVKIFNRYGTVVYEKANYKNEWDGKSIQGNRLPDGTYYYYIEFMNNKPKTGWVYLTHEY